MSDQLKVGATVRVRSGVTAPDLDEFTIEGWVGVITQVSGKKAAPKYFIEWNDETIAAMPADYEEVCESRQLYFRMTCLGKDDIEAVDGAA